MYILYKQYMIIQAGYNPMLRNIYILNDQLFHSDLTNFLLMINNNIAIGPYISINNYSNNMPSRIVK
jgi:hypothetical protein